MENRNKALFIDIFNILIRCDKVYPRVISEIRFSKKILDKIDEYHKKGYFICLVNDMSNNYIFDKRFHDKIINVVLYEIQKEFNKANCNVIYYSTSDKFFDYPNPGGIYNYCIENDVILADSIYLTNNDVAKSLSSTGDIL